MVEMPGVTGEVLSPLYVDQMPLDAVLDVLAGQSPTDASTAAPSRFWATVSRPADSLVRESLEVRSSAARLVNRVQFQAANFPSRIWVQRWDEDSSEWVPMTQPGTGREVMVSIDISVPAVLRSDVHDSSTVHPQHRGAGHWQNVDLRVTPVTTSRIRLVLARSTKGRSPVDGYGQPTDYSLAVKDFEFGYEISSVDDVPATANRSQMVDEAEAFGYASDILGSGRQYAAIEYRANDLSAEGLVWKSSLQPIAEAVVPLWVDARDADGSAQTVDRFEVDPLTTGVATNLYYSSADPDYSVPVRASDDDLTVSVPGNSPGLPGALTSGVTDVGENLAFIDASLVLQDRQIQWVTDQPWWVGMAFQPAFTPSGASRVLVDTARFGLRWSSSRQCFTVRVHGTEVYLPTFDFQFNQQMRLVARFDPSTQVVTAQIEGSDQVSGMVTNEPLSIPFTLGASAVGAPMFAGQTGQYRLRQMVVKQEVWTEGTAEAYFADPEAFVLPGSRRDSTGTDNAIVRIHPALRAPSNLYGIKGGPGHFQHALRWVPINRDFRLTKGTMRFDPVRAKFFKFEFTNLSVRPYSATRPVLRDVLLFPGTALASAGLRKASGGAEAALGGAGAVVNQSLAVRGQFLDQRGVRASRTTGYADYMPTEALYSKDPLAADRLTGLSPVFGLTPWHQGDQAPRFTATQRHEYEKVQVLHDSKVAYEVGLRSLRMFKVVYEAGDDTEEYQVHFHDGDIDVADEDTFPWDFAPTGGLVSPEVLAADVVTSTSPLLRSRRNVSAIQFAASQSPAVQRLNDPDFNDEHLARWEPYGNASLSYDEGLASNIGTMVTVRRSAEGAFWNYLESRWPSWNSIEDSDSSPLLPTWDDLAAAEVGLVSFGGVQSNQWVQPARRGRMYAAARVYASKPITSPLHLQIVGENGEVLSDQTVTPKTGQISEWYTAWSISEGSIPEHFNSWDDVDGDTWNATEGDTWDGMMGFAATISGYQGQVSVRLFQEGATQDEFSIDNISLFEDSIVWEFSNNGGQTWYAAYDIRNNPEGVMVFPSTVSENVRPDASTALRWRVSAYRPGLRVSHLVLRPWYASMGRGVLPKETIERGGINLAAYDQYPATVDSPHFKAWSLPVPESWYFVSRQSVSLNAEIIPQKMYTLDDALVLASLNERD